MEIKIFDVLQVDFGESLGCEQDKKRPCVVVQNDMGNKYSPTLIVIPLTTELKKLNLPTHGLIHKSVENCLTENSMLLGEQVRVIDKRRVLYKRGHLVNDKDKNTVIQVYLANITGKRNCAIS